MLNSYVTFDPFMPIDPNSLTAVVGQFQHAAFSPQKKQVKIIPKIGGRQIDDIYTVSIGYRKILRRIRYLCIVRAFVELLLDRLTQREIINIAQDEQ